MARIKLSSEQNDNPIVQGIFAGIIKARGAVPAPYRAFAILPHILQANWNKTKSVHGNGEIPVLFKDAIACLLYTSDAADE